MNFPQGLSRGDLEALAERHVRDYCPGKTARERRRAGIGVVLNWLEGAEGEDWQQRWEQLENSYDDWASNGGSKKERTEIFAAVQIFILERVIRPSYTWILADRRHRLYSNLRSTTDKEAFDTLMSVAPGMNASGTTVQQAMVALSRIGVHTGKSVVDLTTEDILDYGEFIRSTGRNAQGVRVAHQLLREADYLHDPPLTLGYTQRLDKPSVEELVNRHNIECTEVRNLLIMYLKEREPAVDYVTVKQLADRLAKQFWRDIELHHPGIESINLPREVIEAWKKRSELLRDGRPRKDSGQLYVVVRSFYLDILQWAAENPGRWEKYVVPCPISDADVRALGKADSRRKARTHERIRRLEPLLPRLLADVRRRLGASRGLLEAAEECQDGQEFVFEGRTFERLQSPRSNRKREFGSVPVMVRPVDEEDGKTINCLDQEDEAFWAWAIVEVLRLTGARVEELLELTHLSIHQHRMPDNEQVLLLQIAPSKRDRERVLPVCPELSHVLAQIVRRVQGSEGEVPAVERYDPLERVMSSPMPYLFQRRWRLQGSVMGTSAVWSLIKRASQRAGLKTRDGESVYFTPHDFRRLFATEAVNGGLPIHIAAKLLGHLDLNTTRGYVAVYSEEVIRHYRSHLARRRVLRPEVEYREPTEEEWEEFSKHFRRRKMALGDCYRPYGSDCPHEHACVRCPMLRMDPNQLPRLLEIEQNTVDLLAEAENNGWEGEESGLKETLQHIQEKKGQAERTRSLRPESNTPPTIVPLSAKR